MTNAPTTRETADHADHIGDATTMIDHAELARLAEAAMRVRRDAVGRLDGGDAVRIWGAFLDAMTPAVCSALLSEIAALRAKLDAEIEQHGETFENFRQSDQRAAQAERQRDEAVGLLKRWSLTRGEMSGAGTVETATRAFLADQGADQ